MSPTTTSPKNLLRIESATADDMRDFVKRGCAQQAFVYHVGHLDFDAHRDSSRLVESRRIALLDMRSAAWSYYLAGLVDLVQHRHGDDFEYIAIRTSVLAGHA